MFAALTDEAAIESLRIANQYYDDEGAYMESLADLAMVGEEISSLETMSDTIDNLNHLHFCAESFGLTRAQIAFADRGNHLSRTITSIPALESMKADFSKDSAENKAAMEGIVGAAKEMVAKFFKKAWDVATGLFNKLTGFAKAAYDKVVAAAKVVKEKTISAAKATKETIKAHPVAAGLVAVGAVVGLSTIITAVWGLALPTSAQAMGPWLLKIKDLLKRQVTTNSVMQGGKEVKTARGLATSAAKAVGDKAGDLGKTVSGAAVNAKEAVQSGTATALGYTKEQSGKFFNAVIGLFKKDGAIGKIVAAMTSGMKKAWDFVTSQAGKDGTARKAFINLFKTTFGLIRKTVFGAGSIIMSIVSRFRALFHAPLETVAEVGGAAD